MCSEWIDTILRTLKVQLYLYVLQSLYELELRIYFERLWYTMHSADYYPHV